jgi:hypothetical protein
MAADAGSGILYYVYALAAPGLPRRFTVRAHPLQAIDIAGLAAVVEAVPDAPQATEEALREQHAVVVELAGRSSALLPVRFGTLVTPAELDARIKYAHDVILDALDHVRGRVQMTIRMHSDPAPSTSSSRLSSGTAYLAARSERERELRRAAVKVRDSLSRLVMDQRIDSGKGDLLGTVYHLIKTGDVDRYRAAMEAVTASLAPARLTVTGPWPAFAFAPELKRA